MAFIPLALAGASMWEGQQSRKAVDEATRQQMQAYLDALKKQEQQYNYSQYLMAPSLAAGREATTQYNRLLGLTGDKQAAMQELQTAPGYASGLAQGTRSLEAGIGARGGMGSGKALQATKQYGEDYLTRQYQNRLAQLGSAAGAGQQAATTAAGLGQQYAGQYGNLAMGMGNVGASGTLGRADINRSTIGGLAGLGMQYWGGKSTLPKPSYQTSGYDTNYQDLTMGYPG